MRPFFFILLLLATSTAVLGATPQSAEEQLTAHFDEYLKLIFDFDPVFATQMGDHRLDRTYPNFTANAVNKLVSNLRSLKAKLRKVNQEQLGVDAKIDYALLESNIESQIIMLTGTALYRDNPKLFSESAISGVYFLMISSDMSDEDRLNAILGRLTDLPDFLNSAQRQLKNPPQIWAILAKEEAESAAALLSEIGAYYSGKFPDRRKDIDSRFATAAGSLQDYSDFLSDFAGRDGQSFAVGRETFNRLLKTNYFLDYDVDTLIVRGEVLLEQAQRNYDSLSAVVEKLPPPAEPNTFVPRTFRRGDILDYYQWEIDQAREWVANRDFATVPKDLGECIPVETPQFLRNVIGAVAYEPPGPLSTTQIGRFYVRPLPDTLDDANRSAFFRYCYSRGFRRSVVHEAYPGHHFQMLMSNRHPSMIRRFQRNNLMVEGWALYCEEAVYEAGFYGSDPRQQLAIAGGVRFRAARILLDCKLHTGQMTYQQAIDWLVEKLGASLEYAESEISRYTLQPTQPMSYLIGKEQIKELREAFRQKMGAEYSLKRFHDMLLGEGSIPPSLLLRKINEQIL